MTHLYVIDSRNEDGSLDLSGLQPEQVFGMKAITGITEDEMAKVIFRKVTDATLDGGSIGSWPKYIDKRFVARKKTW